jgi:hypothetical protein
MTGLRPIIGTCALCALVLSGLVAQSATAAGTTEFTCKKVIKDPVQSGFSASHCKPADAVLFNAEFKHFAVPNGTLTENISFDFNTSEEHTGAKLKATVAGSAIELVAAEVSGSGTSSNSESGGEMIASGEGKLTYSGVTEKLLGCKVVGIPGGAGVVETKQLALSTAGVGDKVKVSPKEGTVFAEFKLEGCAVANTYKVVGSVLVVPNGCTLDSVHNTVTGEKTLRLQSALGPVAGIEGTLTRFGRANHNEAFTPLGYTT